MINFEKFKDKIEEMAYRSEVIALNNGELVNCDTIICGECGFYGEPGGCRRTIMKWFFEEYQEPRKITEREYNFCKALDCGYITKDFHGFLGWYRTEPIMAGGIFHQQQPGERLESEIFTVFGVWFDYINNGECFEVREILKWDVIPEAVVEE